MLDCHHQIISAAVRDCSERKLLLIATASNSWENSDDGYSNDSQSSSTIDHEDVVLKLETREEGNSPVLQTKVVKPRLQDIRINFLIVFAGTTVLLVGIIGIFFAPAISIDTKAVWLIVGSGKTYSEAVSSLPVFQVITEILLQSRVALDSVADYVGLGFLLVLVVAAAIAFPLINAVANFRKWNCQRRSLRSCGSRSSSLRRTVTRAAVESLARIKSRYRLMPANWRLRIAGGQRSDTANEMVLFSFYTVKAWRQMEVYLSAFVVACWQLGAVAAYTIHLYCYFMEMLYNSFENLGLVQSTSAQCFRIQLAEPSTVAIVWVGFLVLLGSFVLPAKSHYNRIMDSAHCD